MVFETSKDPFCKEAVSEVKKGVKPSSTNPHNVLNLTLRIHTQPEDDHNRVIWSLDNSDELSPSSLSPPSRDGRGDDSGFSSDASLLLMQKNKLSRSKSARSASRSPALRHSDSGKSVRFADSLGLDLVHRNYYDADDVNYWDVYDSSTLLFNREYENRKLNNVALSLDNLPKRTDEEISHLAKVQYVCLHSASVLGTNFTGIIDVLNISTEKQIFVKYTTDNWESSYETPAIFTNTVRNDGVLDAFKFLVSLPAELAVGATCYFCIRYVVNNNVYWDNNNGSNYRLEAMLMDAKKEVHENKMRPKSYLEVKKNLTERAKENLTDMDDDCDCSSIPFSQRFAIRQQWKRQKRVF